VSVALVTGATGLVGSHIVDRLISDGWRVRILSRRPDLARAELPSEVDIRTGDVLDQGSFERAATGVDAIFHAAASVIARGGWEAYRVTNVEGTRNAIAAARSATARLLHVSSVAVYGPSARYDAARRGGRTDETTALAPLKDSAFYARSKRDSEQLVLGAHREGRIWATAVRPDVVYGPRDRQFVPRMGALLMKRVPIPLLRGGRSILAVVQAENVALGAVLAATSDVAGGKAYNLANDFDVSSRRFFELAADGLGRRALFVPLPIWAARGAAWGSKLVSKTLTGGRFSMVSNAAIDFLAEDNPFSSELAKHELGWTPTLRPEIAIPEAFRWWRSRASRA
jgi:nucleoside-diphosphate-sugar epimerase